MRIVALLLALATLAERACFAPLAVRVTVMGLLRPAELAAWDFVQGDAAMPEPVGPDHDPAAAMLLAARFRALAVMLAAFADRFCGGGSVQIAALPAAVEAALVPAEQGCARPRPFDTS
ncbi:hypothetical protein ABMA46_19805 [Mesorhizobium sp. CN5-321]|uniref:hypothetical protein n=1 Tax=Mesorhizobium hunchu TaxID=3157708 RepID=UPI0032B868CB